MDTLADHASGNAFLPQIMNPVYAKCAALSGMFPARGPHVCRLKARLKVKDPIAPDAH